MPGDTAKVSVLVDASLQFEDKGVVTTTLHKTDGGTQVALPAELRHVQISVAGSALHVVECGPTTGPAVLFLHGWPQSAWSWHTVMSRAGENGRRAIAVDLPGVGGSEPDGSHGSKKAIAATIHELVGLLDLHDLTIVGHDVGGMVAYAYLRQYDDVARLVIVDTAIPGVNPWTEVLANPYIWHFAFHAIPRLPELLVEGHQAEYFDYFYRELAADAAAITTETRNHDAEAYQSSAALTAGFDFYRAFAEDARDNASYGKGAPTQNRLLYVRGGARPFDIEPYATGFRAAGVKNVTTAVMANVGHFIADEAPDDLWRLIADFSSH